MNLPSARLNQNVADEEVPKTPRVPHVRHTYLRSVRRLARAGVRHRLFLSPFNVFVSAAPAVSYSVVRGMSRQDAARSSAVQSWCAHRQDLSYS